MSQPPLTQSAATQSYSLADTGLFIAATVMILGAIWLCITKISPPQNSSPSTVLQPTEGVATPSPQPSASPTPIPSLAPPKPTRVVTSPPPRSNDSADSDSSQSKNCIALKNGGFSDITIELQPRSGQMTGDTVIRLKQGGSCPGPSTSEQWISSGERQKTFSHIAAGTYVIEIANGNYKGVVRQTVTVAGARQYVFAVPIKD